MELNSKTGINKPLHLVKQMLSQAYLHFYAPYLFFRKMLNVFLGHLLQKKVVHVFFMKIYSFQVKLGNLEMQTFAF